MKLCDVTIAYNEKSGGIRTYIDEKRRYLENETEHEHLLIVPGEADRVERRGRSTVVHIESPLIPRQDSYRLFVSRKAIRRVLTEHQPDVVELGSYYLSPWAAFTYRRRRRQRGLPCVVGGYFHTDVADAYVGAPLRTVAHHWVEDVSETLGHAMERLAEVASKTAEQYIRYIFEHCDVRMAAAPAQAHRLGEYGVEDVRVVPMGVDLQLFNPSRRDLALRERLGVSERDLALVYAGRLSTEKHVPTLVEALKLLPPELNASLWILGDGPLRDEIGAAASTPQVKMLAYETERERLAATLASADVYVTAGPHETFGLSVIEAQACGLPVVGVEAGALRQRVLPGLGYLGAIDDARAMAQNIERAWRERAELSRNARAHVEAHFSWSNAFRTLMGLYEDALERAPLEPDPVKESAFEAFTPAPRS